MTQSSSCAGTGLLEFRAVESGRVSHLRTEGDKGRQIIRATAILRDGRLHYSRSERLQLRVDW